MNSIEIYSEEGVAEFTINQAAKLLDFKIGRTNLLVKFRGWGLLLGDNSPSQNMIDRGYMNYKLKKIEFKRGNKKVPVTLVTIEGLAFLKKFIAKKLREVAGYILKKDQVA